MKQSIRFGLALLAFGFLACVCLAAEGPLCKASGLSSTRPGDTLMDLVRNWALKMQARKTDGVDYLVIEAGGFDARHGPDWKPPLCVMNRAEN